MTVLHPKYKLNYFVKKDWNAESIKAIQKLMFEEFDQAYAHLWVPAGAKILEEKYYVENKKVQFWKYYYDEFISSFLQVGKLNNMFDDLDNLSLTIPETGSMDLKTGLKRYLSQKTDPTVKDVNVLSWWKAYHHEFPCLYQMAFNYHTIPGKITLWFQNFEF